MCGIAGFVVGDGSSKEISHRSLVNMTRALVHRGPDDEGYYWRPNVGLGSRRLSIIDLSTAGRMPLYNETRTVAVVQNGEIYNFKSLRRDLIAKGHRFLSDTDTEIVVHLYEEVGTHCFEYLEGMYATAIWDQAEKKLVLARDRFGEKPLYYFEDADSMAFASELRSFVYYPFFGGDLDWDGLDQFLTLGYILAPRTPYLRARKLFPGHYLVFDQTAKRSWIHRYWTPPICLEPIHKRSEQEYVKEFDSLFAESVRSRMVSDVPVGAFLSGGIDSSLVVAGMSRLSAGSVRTFSIGFAGSETHNENPVAQEFARMLSVDHATLNVELSDVLKVIEKLPALCDEPIGDPALIGVYLISKFARDCGITVMLSGDGGDELFFGYPFYRQIKVLEAAYRLPRMLRRVTAETVAMVGRTARNGRLEKAARLLRQDSATQAAYYLSGYGAWSGDELCSLRGTSEALKNEGFASVFEDPSHRTALDRAYAVLLSTYLPDNNLARMDRASMANSVEVRTPFLNPRIAQFAAELPLDLKLRGSRSKYILRKHLSGIACAGMSQRPKHGFNAFPMAVWLRTDLHFLIREFLDPQEIKRQGFFDSECTTRVINQHKKGGSFECWWKLWLLLVLQMWLRGRNGGVDPSLISVENMAGSTPVSDR
jgi:asparagine synthase (glutamine-hydrolysing)